MMRPIRWLINNNIVYYVNIYTCISLHLLNISVKHLSKVCLEAPAESFVTPKRSKRKQKYKICYGSVHCYSVTTDVLILGFCSFACCTEACKFVCGQFVFNASF